MPSQLRTLSTAGLSAVAASAINGDSAIGIVATGSTAATAFLLPAANNQVATTAASTGVILPPGSGADDVYVMNSGANALTVYPPATPVGATINGGASVSVPAGKTVHVVYFNATLLGALISA